MNNQPPPEYLSFWSLSPDTSLPGPPPAWFNYWAKKYGYISEPKVSKPRLKRANLFLVTLSPNPKGDTANVGTLHSYVKRRLTKVWIKTFYYCFELTKQLNPHVHLLIETTKSMRASDVLKGFKLPETNSHVRIQDDVDKGLEYLKGFKGGEPKPMFKQDNLFRKKNNLLSIYTNNGSPNQT